MPRPPAPMFAKHPRLAKEWGAAPALDDTPDEVPLMNKKASADGSFFEGRATPAKGRFFRDLNGRDDGMFMGKAAGMPQPAPGSPTPPKPTSLNIGATGAPMGGSGFRGQGMGGGMYGTGEGAAKTAAGPTSSPYATPSLSTPPPPAPGSMFARGARKAISDASARPATSPSQSAGPANTGAKGGLGAAEKYRRDPDTGKLVHGRQQATAAKPAGKAGDAKRPPVVTVGKATGEGSAPAANSGKTPAANSGKTPQQNYAKPGQLSSDDYARQAENRKRLAGGSQIGNISGSGSAGANPGGRGSTSGSSPKPSGMMGMIGDAVASGRLKDRPRTPQPPGMMKMVGDAVASKARQRPEPPEKRLLNAGRDAASTVRDFFGPKKLPPIKTTAKQTEGVRAEGASPFAMSELQATPPSWQFGKKSSASPTEFEAGAELATGFHRPAREQPESLEDGGERFHSTESNSVVPASNRQRHGLVEGGSMTVRATSSPQMGKHASVARFMGTSFEKRAFAQPARKKEDAPGVGGYAAGRAEEFGDSLGRAASGVGGALSTGIKSVTTSPIAATVTALIAARMGYGGGKRLLARARKSRAAMAANSAPAAAAAAPQGFVDKLMDGARGLAARVMQKKP